VVIKKLAPKSLLLASGTIDRAHGVFFTLHPSVQDSVQRTQQFVCYFDVPYEFRGDYVQITCTAVARNRTLGYPAESEQPAGTAKFNVGIYLDGDFEARRAAEQFADRQQDLFDAQLAEQAATAAAAKTSPGLSPTAVYKSVLHLAHLDKGAKTPNANSSVAVLHAKTATARKAMESAKQTLRQMNGNASE
jgi:hypothetical protein